MNRGFGYYFVTSIRTSAKTVLKGGNIFKYYIWFFARLLGTFIPFLNAIFPVAAVRQAKIAKTDGEIAVIRSFGGVESWRSFGTVLLTMTLKGLIYIGGLLVIAAIDAVLGFLGVVIGIAAGMKDYIILAVAFAAPAAIAIVIYSFALVLLFAPTSYLLDSNSEKAGATATLTAAVETMRRGGKFTCFLNAFVPYAIVAVYLGIVSAVTFVLYSFIGGVAGSLAAVFWALIAFAALVAFAPVFALTARSANNELFRDIALEPTALDNRAKGVFIKKVRTNVLAQKGLDSDLLNLFDSTEKAESVPKFTSYSEPGKPKRKVKTYEKEEDVPDKQDIPKEQKNSDEPQPAQTDTGNANGEQSETASFADESFETIREEQTLSGYDWLTREPTEQENSNETEQSAQERDNVFDGVGFNGDDGADIER